ncbi:hypothetical protein DOS77_00120 [Staphylococcus felis]|nr:hypothetical protein DOS57_00070 [Staphylococcus felis]REI17951.1 hypothetical protein DOS73_00685 [Staphylococcus felis]REI25726.1 hypothetical protein DOS77_00120 [Staphylococcus felis]REI32459.1 hypothetical protein DOS82_10220 [Staphylococcus felis]
MTNGALEGINTKIKLIQRVFFSCCPLGKQSHII